MKKFVLGGNVRVFEPGGVFHHTNMQVYAC